MRKRWQRFRYLLLEDYSHSWQSEAAIFLAVIMAVTSLLTFIGLLIIIGNWSGMALIMFMLLSLYIAFLVITKETTKK